jgi:hypothetical protein
MGVGQRQQTEEQIKEITAKTKDQRQRERERERERF